MLKMLNRVKLTRLKSIARSYYTVNSKRDVKENFIAKNIYSQIKSTGPITVAEYMKQVLIHPMGGYYMHKDVFGETGDFITSPEICQIFGEMIAIWFLNEWSKVGSPKPLQIVELGPGRGSLSQDLLRVFNHFGKLKECTLNLVEVSPLLSDLQAKKLCVNSRTIADTNSPFYREGIGFEGIPIKWYRTYNDVPDGFTLIVAHEFFDALPIHKFRKTDSGFREILIDIDVKKQNTFRYVISHEHTPASQLCCQDVDNKEHLEVSLEGLVLVKEIARKLEEHGGLALIADYGHNGEDKDSFRSFKNHKLHDPLVEPGTADLTADVDFMQLRKAATEEGRVLAFGPTTQRDFLLKMGIEHRVRMLQQSVSDEVQKTNLQANFNMITDNDKMGSRFKFLALLPSVLEKLLSKVPVAGFN